MTGLNPLFNSSRDHFYGNPLAEIELVQYGDLQCRECAATYAVINLLYELERAKFKMIFRHFPLPTKHPLSLEAAIACEAAARQGKFWAMHDLIYENQKYLSRRSLYDFADELRLDKQLYELSREDKKINDKIIADFESGIKSGVSRTPTFFINGFRYNGTNDFDSLYKACKYIMSFEDAERGT